MKDTLLYQMVYFQHLGEHNLSSCPGRATEACGKAGWCEIVAGRKSWACRCDIQGLRGKFYPFFLLHDVKQQAVNMAFIKITLYTFNSLDNQISATVSESKVCFYSRPCKTLISPSCTGGAWSFLTFLVFPSSHFPPPPHQSSILLWKMYQVTEWRFAFLRAQGINWLL